MVEMMPGSIVSGSHSPDRKAIGRYSMLSSAGAALPPTTLPTNRPIAQNGSTPSTLMTNRRIHCDGSSSTPATVAAITASTSEMIAANSIAITIFASSIAPGGTGNARLRRSRPFSRSTAMLTPKPNRPAPITPNAP